jgi:hypothetical protein
MRRFYLTPLLNHISEDVANNVYEFLVVSVKKDLAGNAVKALLNNDLETIQFIQNDYNIRFRFADDLERSYIIKDNVINIPICVLKEWVAKYNTGMNLEVLKHFAPIEYSGIVELFIQGGYWFEKFIHEAPAQFSLSSAFNNTVLSSDRAIDRFVVEFIEREGVLDFETLRVCLRSWSYDNAYNFNERNPTYNCDLYFSAIKSDYYDSMCFDVLNLFPKHILGNSSPYGEDEKNCYIRRIIGSLYRENQSMPYMIERIEYVLNSVYGDFGKEFILVYQILYGTDVPDEVIFRSIGSLCLHKIEHHAEFIVFMICFGVRLNNTFISSQISSVVVNDVNKFINLISGYFKYYISIAVRLCASNRNVIEAIAEQRIKEWKDTLLYPDSDIEMDWFGFY